MGMKLLSGCIIIVLKAEIELDVPTETLPAVLWEENADYLSRQLVDEINYHHMKVTYSRT